MKKEIILLWKEFQNIRKRGLIEKNNGLENTFWKNIKSGEQFKNIYVKFKLGYTTSPITLFSLNPKRSKSNVLDYIFKKYSHNRYDDLTKPKIFSEKIYAQELNSINNYHYRLKIDYLYTKVILEAYYNNEYLEDVCYWNFKDIETILKKKMNYFVIIFGYPYKRGQKPYYKYLKMEVYKLKSFWEFLNLINKNKIYVQIRLQETNGSLKNYGVAFKIAKEDLNKLFYKVNKLI